MPADAVRKLGYPAELPLVLAQIGHGFAFVCESGLDSAMRFRVVRRHDIANESFEMRLATNVTPAPISHGILRVGCG